MSHAASCSTSAITRCPSPGSSSRSSSGCCSASPSATRRLVSSAREDIRDSLRRDLRQTASERDAARAQVAAERSYGDKAYPILTDRRLRGRKIGLVTLGPTDISADDVRDWLDPSGASLSLVAELNDDVDTAALAERARGTRYDRVTEDPELLSELGLRAGIQMVLGGKLVSKLRRALLQSTSGEFGGLDAVIVARPSKAPKDKKDADRLAALQDGVVRGLAQTGVKVVGIEASDADPSQIGWYRDRELLDRRQHRRDRRAGGARLRPRRRRRRVRTPRQRAGPAATRRGDCSARAVTRVRRLRAADRAGRVSVRSPR